LFEVLRPGSVLARVGLVPGVADGGRGRAREPGAGGAVEERAVDGVPAGPVVAARGAAGAGVDLVDGHPVIEEPRGPLHAQGRQVGVAAERVAVAVCPVLLAGAVPGDAEGGAQA